MALGFDTFLVQRHGIRFRPDNELDQQSALFSEVKNSMEVLQSAIDNEQNNLLMGSQLGCYYCNDVFAPGDVSDLDVIWYILARF